MTFFSYFFDLFVSNSLKPKVTVPTRLTDTTCTLIHNILSSLTSSVPDISGILVSNISDHLPCFTCFETVFLVKLTLNIYTNAAIDRMRLTSTIVTSNLKIFLTD